MKMKFFNYAKTLLAVTLILLLGAGGMFVSCSDDEENKNVVLDSFGPAGVHHGDVIKFIGVNLDKVTSIVLPGIEVPASQFASQQSRLIELVVPIQAEAGLVVLKTPAGEIQSITPLDFEVPVEITSVTGEAKPGTNITIQGEFVNWIQEIIFNDGVSQTEFVSKSVDEVVVMVPFEAQSGFLVFRTGGTEPLTFSFEEPLTVIVPTVSGVSPTTVKHTDNITITGTDLDLITEISFGGSQSTSDFVSQSETEIVVEVPVGTLAGTLTLRQASPISIVTGQALTVVLPKGTNLSPKPATPGVSNITITGTDLDLIAKLTLVGLEETSIELTEFVTHTATQIVFVLPETAANGPVAYETIHGYSSNLGVSVSVPTAGPAPLDYYIYDDQYKNGWSNWGGWGHTEKKLDATDEVLVGTYSIKMTFNDQYGALQIGSPAANVFSGYSTLSFQIFAPAPQNLIVQLNNDADSYLSIPAGWSLVELPISGLAGNGNVAELRIKNNNGNLPVTLYFDEIGLKF